MSKVAQFLGKHPGVDGYTLICVLDEISRRVKVSADTLLSVALVDSKAADFLIRTVAKLEPKAN